MNKPRSQHYVPRFYLEGFTVDNDERLFVFDKDENKIFPKNIDKVCEESYYYSYKDNIKENTAFNFVVEEELSKKESEFSSVLHKIRNYIDGYYYYSKGIDGITRNDRLIFLKFLYYQILRVPKYIDILFSNGKEFLIKLNNKYNYVQNDKEMINDIKKIMFPKLFDNMGEFISIMNKKNWAFFIIDKNIKEYFISSDNPVIMSKSKIDGRKVGIINPMSEISIPISKNILLTIRETFIEHKVECGVINSAETIKNINELIKENSMRFIYSGLERLIR